MLALVNREQDAPTPSHYPYLIIRNPVVKGLLKPAGSSLGLYGRSPPARAKSENRLLPIGFGITVGTALYSICSSSGSLIWKTCRDFIEFPLNPKLGSVFPEVKRIRSFSGQTVATSIDWKTVNPNPPVQANCPSPQWILPNAFPLRKIGQRQHQQHR